MGTVNVPSVKTSRVTGLWGSGRQDFALCRVMRYSRLDLRPCVGSMLNPKILNAVPPRPVRAGVNSLETKSLSGCCRLRDRKL